MKEDYQRKLSSFQTDDKSSVAGSLASNDLIQIVPKLNYRQFDQDVHAGYYIHPKTLSKGRFGKVRLATHLTTFQLVTLKVINKRRFRNATDKNMVSNEINSLKVLSHRNISRLFQLIEDDKCIYIVREYCSNGDLLNYVERKGKLNELKSKLLFSDLINCLGYIHKKGILHGDIRPENVLLDSSFRIKLIGFQLAHHHFDIGESPVQELAVTKTYISREYTAPETLNGSSAVSTPAIDVWSAGVLLYFITTGSLPFAEDSLVQLVARIQTGIFELPSTLSAQLSDLIVSMLKVSPVERASVKQILSHQWLQQQQQEVKKMALKTSEDSVDGLNEAALKECLMLHSHEVQNDIVQMRFNILSNKFGYHTATYWLIKENFEQYKSLGLKLGSTALRNRLQQIADQKCQSPEPASAESAESAPAALGMRRGHTFMESRVAPNSPKVVVKSCKSKLSDGEESAITASLGTSGGGSQQSEHPSESKKPHKVPSVLGEHHRRTSIDVGGGGGGKDTENCLTAESTTKTTKTTSKSVALRPTMAKSHFNLSGIFSRPQIADERSNWSESIAERHHQSADHCGPSPSPSSQQVLSHTLSFSSLRQSLARRLTSAFSTKFFSCKNLWQVNSASAAGNKSGGGVGDLTTAVASTVTAGKRAFSRLLLRRDQSDQSSLTETTDSDEQRVNRPSKSLRCRSLLDTHSLDQTDGQNWHWHQQWDTVSSISSTSSSTDTFSPAHSSLSSSSSSGHHQESLACSSKSTSETVRPVVNRQKTTTTAGMLRLKGSSLVIITRYSNYEECRREVLRIFSRKGIICKAENQKMRCYLSAMNEIVLVFRADFLPMPSMNGGTFVIIKVKKLRGSKEDFHVIADYLKNRFERRHLRLPRS